MAPLLKLCPGSALVVRFRKRYIPSIYKLTQPEIESSNINNDNCDDSRSTRQHRILINKYVDHILCEQICQMENRLNR